MTKYQIQAQINTIQGNIDAENNEISGLENKIAKIEAATTKLVNGKDNLSAYCSTQKTKIQSEKSNYSKVRLIDKYIAAVVDVLDGTEHETANGKFEEAKSKLDRKKKEAIDNIDKLEASIKTEQKRISDLRIQYKEIVKKEQKTK